MKDEGMPIYRNPFEKGDLVIKFEVNFPPKNFTDEKKLKVSLSIEFVEPWTTIDKCSSTKLFQKKIHLVLLCGISFGSTLVYRVLTI